MQKKSLPKTAKPREKTRKNIKSTSETTFDNTEVNDSEIRYIDIYAKNAEAEKKIKLLWLITIPATIILIIFWFWLLKQSIANTKQSGTVKDLRDEIAKTMNEIKDNIDFSRTQNTTTTSSTTDINEIKDRVIAQLQKNLDPETWPSHDSEILSISVKYPPDWSQNEQKESITISAPSLTNSASNSAISTDNTYSRILISRKSVSTKTKLEDWIKKNGPSTDDYALASTANKLIDGQKTIIYQKTGSARDDINQIIYVQKENFIYEIKINVSGRKILDESYINGIINNIKFL